MAIILVIEIVSALIGCGALLVLVAQTIRLNREDKERQSGRLGRLRRRHRSIGFVLLAAGVIHGASATLYASGARAETYIMGWASITLFALFGICMVPPVRARLVHATAAHISLFALGVILFIGRAIMERL